MDLAWDTATFFWPIVAIFEIFGPSRSVSILFVAFFGSLTAALTAAIANQFLQKPYVLGAGLIVAFFPSQILWSSVVLRESLIWAFTASVVLVIVISLKKSVSIDIIFSALFVGLLFVGLAGLRHQTAILVLWCAVLAFIGSRQRRLLRIICATCLFVFLPWCLGFGPGAINYALDSLERTGTVQAQTSLNANSSFDYFGSDDDYFGSDEWGRVNLKEWDTTGKPVSQCTDLMLGDDFSSQRTDWFEREAGDLVCVANFDGGVMIVDNRFGSVIERIPKGLYNTMVRPLLFEDFGTGRSRALLAASLEFPIWMVLYCLAIYGFWRFKNFGGHMSFPFFFIVAIALSGAMTHGNLGTAFRHRGQVLFALSLFAMCGLQVLNDRRSAISTSVRSNYE